MKKKAFKELFFDFIIEKKIFKKSDVLLIGMSGGVDSVVLTHLLKKEGYQIAIAHCNFQLREHDSLLDEEFSKSLAESFDIPFFSVKFNTLSEQKNSKRSLEETARDLRYAWFENIRAQNNYTYIVTAHHLNDSIETILLNLIKGTGIKGLRGIKAKNNRIVRPLLFATKAEIEQYAKEYQLKYRTDQSNYENQFQRNLIRNKIIPLLKEINPSLELTFQKNIKHFLDLEIISELYLKKEIRKLCDERKDGIYISTKKLMLSPAPFTLLFAILNPCGFSEDAVSEIYAQLNASGKIFLSKSHKIFLIRNQIILTPISSESGMRYEIDAGKKAIVSKLFRLEFSDFNLEKKNTISEKESLCFLDADAITFPLILRPWKTGDYFYPLGMYKKHSKKPGKKKVSDFLNDLKLNPLEKENIYVLLSGEKIIWIVGKRVDDRFKITSSTKHILKIKMLPR